MCTGGDFQQCLQTLCVSSVCGVNSALPGFPCKVVIQGWSRRSRGAGCSGRVTSQIARTGKEISLWINTRQWHFPKCVFWLLAGSVWPSVDFGLDLVTELTALSSALRLPVRLAERVTWILECQQWRWEVMGITLGCAKSPCSLGLPVLA